MTRWAEPRSVRVAGACEGLLDGRLGRACRPIDIALDLLATLPGFSGHAADKPVAAAGLLRADGVISPRDPVLPRDDP